MPGKDKPADKWRFSNSVLLPVFLVAAVVVTIVGGFIAWSTTRNDTEALNRQITLVSHMINSERSQLAREQQDVAAWDSAVKAVEGTWDEEFIAKNLGVGMFDYFGHDRVFILDPDLRAVYAMRDGATAASTAYDPDRATIEPLARRLRDIDWQGALSAYVNGASEKVPNVSDVVLLEDQPAFISLMPIVSNHKNYDQPPGSEYIHVTAEFLDADLAGELTRLLMLNGAHFTKDEKAGSGEASVAIRNRMGAPVAWFNWVPDRPGARVFEETAPFILGAVLLTALIIAILTLKLRRSTRELQEGHAAAHHLALHDALTGLGNRARFDQDLEEAIDTLDERNGDRVALLLLDLDRFKQVNDTLGHAAGDNLIREVAQRLRPLVRNTDTIARLGGDEFAIVVRHINSDRDISALCERILKAIRMPFDLEAGQAFVGVSIGVAVAQRAAEQSTELARKADIALYDAKDGGRNQYRIFEQRMHEVVQERLAIEQDLRVALRTDDQLDVVFEPLVREDGTEVIGVEASIRWTHPTRGEMPADLFMPVAESCGLVEIVGDYVLHEACRAGAERPGQLMAVRIYPAQLRNPNFFDKVFSILGETGMRTTDLELEVGEKMLTASEEVANATLRRFRQTGIRVALDDFGTGFTSLRLLQKFQVDRIKIDRKLIAELAQSPDPEATTHAVVWLARAIGVEVSADGVDLPEQKDFLARMGCMSFQGKLFTPEGQASWLRVAANLERNMARGTPQKSEEDYLDIEIWDETGS